MNSKCKKVFQVICMIFFFGLLVSMCETDIKNKKNPVRQDVDIRFDEKYKEPKSIVNFVKD